VLDVLARAEYGRLTDDVYADIRTALERRLQPHAQVERLVSIEFDRSAPPTVLRGTIETDAVSVPFEEPL
jgi:CHAD domain-containing protein